MSLLISTTHTECHGPFRKTPSRALLKSNEEQRETNKPNEETNENATTPNSTSQQITEVLTAREPDSQARHRQTR